MEILGVSAVTLIVTQALKVAFSLKKSIVPLVSICVCVIIVGIMYLVSTDVTLTWTAFVNTFISIATANGVYAGITASIKK